MSQGAKTRMDLTSLYDEIERDDLQQESRLDRAEQLRRVTLERPRHNPIPRQLYSIGRLVWNLGIVVIGALAVWGLLVLLFSVDEPPAQSDITGRADLHWQAYQSVRNR